MSRLASLLLVLGLTAGQSSAWQASRVAPEPGATSCSEHFVIEAENEAQARALTPRLEAVYRANVRLARELRLEVNSPAGKLAVLLLRDYADFQSRLRADGLDEQILGYFSPAENRCVFFDFNTHPAVNGLRQELDKLHRQDEGRRRRLAAQIDQSLAGMNQRILQHEAAHMVQANIGLIPPESNAPTWLVEGLAEMFELPFVETGASLGLSVNRYRLREFQQLQRGEELLPALRRLVATTSWHGGADYSLAWALTQYLYVRQRTNFGAYVRAVTTADEAPAGGTLEQFENIFGPLDGEVAARFAAYMEGLIARHLTPQDEVRSRAAP
mgnify:CR=1 FL=1